MVIDDLVVGNETQRTCVVLGGLGFVGRPLVARLLELGNFIVRVADSTPLQLDPESPLSQAISAKRAAYVQFDVRNKSQVVNAIQGSSVVFYTDMTTSYIGDFYHCYKIIVQGAKNVVSACRECKVKQLIYNSSADVVFDGSQDILDEDESLPYPGKFKNMLSDLRCQAEALILFANDNDTLLTCALRPSNVFGPGDVQLVPFFLNRVKSGWEKFIIGSGENMSDFTYVENVAHALICAEEALRSSMASAAGKAFFITNLEPVKFWDFVSLMLEGLGYQRPVIKVPASMVSYGVLLAEWMQEKLGSRKHSNPLSAHCIVRLASCTRTFNCSAAQKHINYSPIITMEEGVTMTIEAFSHLAKDPFVRSSDFNEQSKVDKLLGSGKVADILLWRDEKETFTYFLVVVLLFYWFFLCGRTFVSSAAKLLLLVTLILYGHGHLPSNIFGLTVPRIPSSSFEISEATVKDSSTTILYLWNRVVQIIRALAKGDDWNVFFKVAVSLCFVKMILSRSLNVVIGTALVLPFMSFFIYEQYENEINASVGVLFKIVKNLKGLLMRNLPASAVKFISSYEISNQNEGPARVNNRQ